MTSEKALNDFLETLDLWQFGYKRVLCKYFVAKKEGQKHLLYGMAGFTNEQELEKKNIRIETDQCIAGQEVFDLKNQYYRQFIEALKSEPHVFLTKKEKFILPSRENEAYSMYYDPLKFPLINSTMRSPFLRISGSNDYKLLPDIRTLDLELRGLDTPYEDVQDLFFHLGFSMEILESNRIPHVEYVATMPIQDMSCSIEDGKNLLMNFSFPNKLEKKHFKVGVRLFRKDKSDPRFSVSGDNFKWTEKKGIYTATLEKEIENLEIAKIFPSYAGQNIGTYIAIDPKLVINNRPDIDQVFYNDRSLNDFLASKDANEFEFGVASLLHYYKLSVQRYSGVSSLTDGPDIVAFSNSGHVYIIECTIGTPNHKGKLLKLHNRVEKLRSYYQEKGLNQDLIRPVMFTSLPKENTNEDRADLSNYKISLITKDDFEGLISRIPTPPSDQELFNAAVAAIPSKEPEEQFHLAV